MSNTVIAALAWIGLAAHLIVGVLALRSNAGRQLVPLLNLAIATSIVLYCAQRWYGYLVRGVTWYTADQLLPIYGLAVGGLAAATLTGRASAMPAHWLLFVVHTFVFICAALFLTFFKMKLF